MRKCTTYAGLVSLVILLTVIGWAQVGALKTIPMEAQLPPDTRVTDFIGVGEIHRYLLDLESGLFLSLRVNQQSSDVVVTLFDPDSTVIESVDSAPGIEILDAETRKSGRHWVEIVLFEGSPAGKYEIWIEQLLTPEQNRARLAFESAQADSVIALIKQNAISIKTTEAGHGCDDLQPLKQLIGNARIVALGEASHGTREFFQFKHRMLEFLVEEMGFTAFVIEAIMPECFDINRYVLTGEGDPRKALAGQYFWTWDTQEVLALVEWMRTYNADPVHKRKIKFYGDDMQMGTRAAKVTYAYLQRVDLVMAHDFAASLTPFLNPFTGSFQSTASSEATRERLLKNGEGILRQFEAKKAQFTAASSPSEYSFAHRHASILVQYLRMINTNTMAGSAIRDSSMAENTKWILNEEGDQGRLVLWAHNYHVSNDSLAQGWHLKRMFGNDYFTFGMLFNQGSFQAKEYLGSFAAPSPLNWFTVPPLDPGTPARAFADAGLTLAVLGLRDLKPNHLLRRWFSDLRPTYDYGAMYSDSLSGFSPTSSALAERFDALFFVESTSAAQANPWIAIGRSSQIQPILSNGDFEVTSLDSQPQCWETTGLERFDYSAQVTSVRPYSGNRCLLLERRNGYHYGEVAGGVTQTFRARAWRGQSVTLSVAARVDPLDATSHAYIALEGDVEAVSSPYSQIADSLICVEVPSKDWGIYELKAKVKDSATSIMVSLWFDGNGKAWFDSVVLNRLE